MKLNLAFVPPQGNPQGKESHLTTLRCKMTLGRGASPRRRPAGLCPERDLNSRHSGYQGEILLVT